MGLDRLGEIALVLTVDVLLGDGVELRRHQEVAKVAGLVDGGGGLGVVGAGFRGQQDAVAVRTRHEITQLGVGAVVVG